jgi:hypothetical protein
MRRHKDTKDCEEEEKELTVWLPKSMCCRGKPPLLHSSSTFVSLN